MAAAAPSTAVAAVEAAVTLHGESVVPDELDRTTGRVTIRELARRLGVSPATVSLALGGNPRISESTRRRVGAAAARLRYAPNYAAQSLSRGQAHRIGIALSTAGGPFAKFLRGAHRRAAATGYGLSLTVVDDAAELADELAPLVHAGAIDGVILLDPGYRGLYRTLSERRVPCVVLGQAAAENTIRVDSDNLRVGQDVASHLLDAGYRRALFLGASGLTPTQDRVAGMRSVFGEKAVVCVEATSSADAGYSALLESLDRRLDFDAVVTVTDAVAAGALRGLNERGIVVPRDVGVVGMGNDLAPYLIPALTSVDFDPEELGFRSVDLLLRAVQGDANPYVEIISHRLVARTSTARVRSDLKQQSRSSEAASSNRGNKT